MVGAPVLNKDHIEYIYDNITADFICIYQKTLPSLKNYNPQAYCPYEEFITLIPVRFCIVG